MMFRDQVVVVSGVGPGLGLALISAFAREGARLVLAARDGEKLRAAAATVPDTASICVPTDIAQPADCRRLAEAARDAFGRVDVLVNNAFQLGPMGAICDAELDGEWAQPFEVNVKGSLRMVQALRDDLAASEGAVVMINTVAARAYRAGFASYAIAKGALQTATRMLALELAPRRIRVNAVFPGYIDGPPLRDAFARMAAGEGGSAEDVHARVAASLPLGRIPTSMDVAEAAVFLASRRAQGITGAALDVNAGEYVAL